MKKNVASQAIGCQMTTAADGSDFTGAVTCYVTGNAGTQAVGSVGAGACTHEGNGFHTYAPAQAETNYDHVAFTFKASGAITATVQVYPNFPQTGDSFALIGATGSGLTSLASAANLSTLTGYVDTEVAAILAAVDTEVAAIKTKTDFLPSATAGAAGGLFIAGSNAATTANITGNIIGTVSTVTTLTNLPAITAGWLTAAGIAASALDNKGNWNVGKTGYTLLQSFPSNFASMSITAGGLVDITQAAADKAWGTTARVLTAGTNIVLAKGTGVTGFNDLDAAAVAAATWNAATATYGSAGSYGLLVETNLDAAVSSVGGGGGGVADWTANQKTAIMSILGIPAAGTTPDDPTVGILDTIRDAAVAVKAKTDNLPSDPADASDIAAAFAVTNGKIDTVDDFLDTEMPALTVSVTAIKAKTDNLPIDPADASDIAAAFTTLSAKVDTVDDYLDTEMPALTTAVAAVKAETASIQADTNDLQARLPAALVGGRMDSNLSAISNSTTTLAAFNRAVKGNVIGTVGGGSTTTSIVTSSLTPPGSVADKFKGRILTFSDDTTTANLRGQSTDITANTSAAAPTLTVTALTTAPVSTDTFCIT